MCCDAFAENALSGTPAVGEAISKYGGKWRRKSGRLPDNAGSCAKSVLSQLHGLHGRPDSGLRLRLSKDPLDGDRCRPGSQALNAGHLGRSSHRASRPGWRSPAGTCQHGQCSCRPQVPGCGAASCSDFNETLKRNSSARSQARVALFVRALDPHLDLPATGHVKDQAFGSEGMRIAAGGHGNDGASGFVAACSSCRDGARASAHPDSRAAVFRQGGSGRSRT